MKTSTRKRLGTVLIVAAIVAAVVLQVSGMGFRGFEHRAARNMVWLGISFHWSLLIVGVVAAVGALCLVLPRGSHADSGSTT